MRCYRGGGIWSTVPEKILGSCMLIMFAIPKIRNWQVCKYSCKSECIKNFEETSCTFNKSGKCPPYPIPMPLEGVQSLKNIFCSPKKGRLAWIQKSYWEKYFSTVSHNFLLLIATDFYHTRFSLPLSKLSLSEKTPQQKLLLTAPKILQHLYFWILL